MLLELARYAIAGLGPLLGAFLLYFLQEWSRDRRQVYRAVHAQLSALKTQEEAIRRYQVPTFNEEFRSMYDSGGLSHKWHTALWEDISRLDALRRQASEAAKELRDACYDFVEDLWEQAGRQNGDSQLSEHLLAKRKEGWVTRFGRMGPEVQKDVSGLGREPTELYDAGMETVSEARAAADEATEELVHHIEKMQARLRRALRTFYRRYKKRPS